MRFLKLSQAPLLEVESSTFAKSGLHCVLHHLLPHQERLDTQRKEREEKGDAYSESFKPQRTKVGNCRPQVLASACSQAGLGDQAKGQTTM